MFEVLRNMFKNLREWRVQVFQLAFIAMQKTAHGTFLGWIWVFLKPAMYIACFWFALYLGLKSEHVGGMSAQQYLVWLSAGIIPWFFMQSSLNSGSDVFDKYSYLVNKLKFPIELIPIFYELSLLFVHLGLLACLTVGYFLIGGRLDHYFLQLPLIIALMYIFFVSFSLLVSPLTAMSQDIANILKTAVTPIFWLSGVLFDVTNIHSEVLQILLRLNPVTFFVESYRKVLVPSTATETFKGWIWSDPAFFWSGIGVIVLTIIASLFVFSRLHKEVPDVL